MTSSLERNQREFLRLVPEILECRDPDKVERIARKLRLLNDEYFEVPQPQPLKVAAE